MNILILLILMTFGCSTSEKVNAYLTKLTIKQ
jgi:hypothetical protein